MFKIVYYNLLQADRQQLGKGAGVPSIWLLAQVHHTTGQQLSAVRQQLG